jgi:tetratricopeptide (TPR) repeat protein
LAAYDLFLRALPYLTVLSPANLSMAAQYLKDALNLEPTYAAAHAHLAWCHQIGFHHGGLDGADKTEGLRHARMATTAEVDDSIALAVGALVIGLLAHDWNAAFNAIERAVSINPSSSAAYYFGAFLYGINSQSVVAAKYARRALRLSPFDPLTYQAHLALTFAAIQEERYDEAVTHGAKLAQISPNLGGHVMTYAVALALAGRMEPARQVCARALEIEPSMSISTSRSIIGDDASGIGKKFERGLRLLGVPQSSPPSGAGNDR